MTLLKERSDLVEAMRELKKSADEAGEYTAEQVEEINAKSARIEQIDAQLKAAKNADRVLSSAPVVHEDAPAKSLGEHFIKTAKLDGVKAGTRVSVSSTEFKAAEDVHVRPEGFPNPEFIGVIGDQLQAPRLADIIGKGVITNGTSVTYFVEGDREGDFGVVAENGKKPLMHFATTQRTDALTKIAGVYKESDEILEDAAQLATSINNRGLRRLAEFEDNAILNGGGQPDLTGFLATEGVLTVEGSAATAGDDIYKGLTQVRTVGRYQPDAIVMNPVDFETLRLQKDQNGQYVGGGMFGGSYSAAGIGNAALTPNLWGLPTIVTPAIEQGTALVGAFGSAATLYRKGGVRVEATNSDENDFQYNRIAIRIEERIALAILRPSAFAKVTFADAGE